MRVGILINDMAEVNVDAAIVRRARVRDSGAHAQPLGAADGDGDDAFVLQVTDELVEFSNGCVCCTLRADFAEQLAVMAAARRADGSRRFEYLIVESSGISEPMAVAEVFDIPARSEDDAGGVETDDHGGECEVMSEEEREEAAKAWRAEVAAEALRRVAYLDCLVTVVDGINWPAGLNTTDSLASRNMAAGPGDVRAVSELMIEQV
jgi:G3E family GTPase